jgi:hypothetical protein
VCFNSEAEEKKEVPFPNITTLYSMLAPPSEEAGFFSDEPTHPIIVSSLSLYV